MVTHNCYPAFVKQRQEDEQFKATLGCMRHEQKASTVLCLHLQTQSRSWQTLQVQKTTQLPEMLLCPGAHALVLHLSSSFEDHLPGLLCPTQKSLPTSFQVNCRLKAQVGFIFL